jgi:hypothetical protein
MAPSAESLTIECRSDGLYFAYQLDNLPVCSNFACTFIKARTGAGSWTKFSAHNGSHSGFVRNSRSTFKRNGETAEVLLKQMLSALYVEFLNPASDAAVRFKISEDERKEIKAVSAECG